MFSGKLHDLPITEVAGSNHVPATLSTGIIWVTFLQGKDYLIENLVTI